MKPRCVPHMGHTALHRVQQNDFNRSVTTAILSGRRTGRCDLVHAAADRKAGSVERVKADSSNSQWSLRMTRLGKNGGHTNSRELRKLKSERTRLLQNRRASNSPRPRTRIRGDFRGNWLKGGVDLRGAELPSVIDDDLSDVLLFVAPHLVHLWCLIERNAV